VEEVKHHQNMILLKLKGIEDIETAKKYQNCFLKIHRRDAVLLPAGTYFICDLIGFKVYTTEGRYLGELRDILQTGSNDVYVVEGDGRPLLISALKEVVKTIDLEGGTIKVDLPGGLEDEI